MRSIPSAARTFSPDHPLSLSRACGFLLAVLATGTSAWIAVIAGVERGAQPFERTAWAAVGIVLLLGAHLIPALTNTSSRYVRVSALLLWVVCLLSTGYGHATFFMVAQRHVGDMRAAAVQHAAPSSETLQPGGRSLDLIAHDQARTTAALASVRNTRCALHCEALAVRGASLAAQLTALKVEADEAHRRERFADRAAAAHDQLMAREDSERRDPVTAALADELQVPRATVDLIVALTLGWILEGVACLGWILALSKPSRVVSHTGRQPVAASNVVDNYSNVPSRNQQVTGAVTAASNVVSNGAVTVSNAASRHSRSESEGGAVITSRTSELLQLASAITDGRVRPTVKDIRRFLRCSQDKASLLRHQFLELAAHGSQTTDAARATGEASGPRLVHSGAGRSQAA